MPVAVVTGAAGGLGIEITARLSRDGYFVAALDITADATPECDSVTRWQCDVTDRGRVEQVVAEIAVRYGGIDVLVNNAGLLTGRSSFLDTTSEEMHRVFAVNAVGALVMTQTCVPHLRESGRARVVNVASRTFFTGGPGQLAYVASKGALIGMTRVMARELGSHEITVNAVMPAQVATPGTTVHSGPDDFAKTMSQQAIRRSVTPADFAGLVAFVASPDASMITGQTLVCDGGALMH